MLMLPLDGWSRLGAATPSEWVLAAVTTVFDPKVAKLLTDIEVDLLLTQDFPPPSHSVFSPRAYRVAAGFGPPRTRTARPVHVHGRREDADDPVPHLLLLGRGAGGTGVVVGGESVGQAPHEPPGAVLRGGVVGDYASRPPCDHLGVPTATSQRCVAACGFSPGLASTRFSILSRGLFS